MKKIMITLLLALVGVSMGFSQKFAYVDTEYILGRIPAYQAAQNQLDKLSADWQKEIEAGKAEVEKLYKNYQAERVLLTEEMRTKREDEIIKREKEVKDLQKKYFAPEGELYKKRQELVKPVQDQIFNAIKEMADEGSYAIIFDSASGPTMLYTNPRYDKSDEVLKKMGIQN
ncbi:MAG: OmpH family outer membrane protein [Bacteroidales bacterium]|nr:OmpH family outer membrane protein [Bacteroidales bacterium]